MFKALVGRGHPEFSTNRQQDAQEFLLHFINMVEVKWRPHSACLSSPQLVFHTALFFSPTHRGIAAPGPTRLKPSGSWWRRGLCVSSRRKPSTHSEWITSSSCLCRWTRLPIQVKGSRETMRLLLFCPVSSLHSAHSGEQDNGKAGVMFWFMSPTVSPEERAQNQNRRENKGLGARHLIAHQGKMSDRSAVTGSVVAL